ncbi:hypothetical protein BS78_10G118800 [Paspalum vaginatum]|nr:hypothetical protein BS78_10G118800 [Paspalum vaginatum]
MRGSSRCPVTPAVQGSSRLIALVSSKHGPVAPAAPSRRPPPAPSCRSPLPRNSSAAPARISPATSCPTPPRRPAGRGRILPPVGYSPRSAALEVYPILIGLFSRSVCMLEAMLHRREDLL